MDEETNTSCPYCKKPFMPDEELTTNENEDVVHLECELAFDNESQSYLVEVVNMRTCNPQWGQPGDVRIDRRTKWGNPFIMKKESDRDRVCDDYERYFLMVWKERDLNIEELLGAKRLGCWCKPKRCHGDFLKSLIDHERIRSMIQ